MKKTATIAALTLGIAVLADIEGDYNTWLGYLAGEDASGNRTTVQGAGAGGGAEDLYRTDLIGAASGVYGVRFYDTVGIGYRALRYSCDVSNTVAIGSHAFEGVSMGGITDATWINGHFVANPPKNNGSWWQQTPGEFYITGDASKTNGLAPIWYDGTNLHLRGYSPGDYINTATNYTEQVATEFVDGTRTVGLAQSAFRSYHLVKGDGSADVDYEDILYAATNALAGQTFDLSTDEGLREAVSNIIIKLGGSIQLPE